MSVKLSILSFKSLKENILKKYLILTKAVFI